MPALHSGATTLQCAPSVDTGHLMPCTIVYIAGPVRVPLSCSRDGVAPSRFGCNHEETFPHGMHRRPRLAAPHKGSPPFTRGCICDPPNTRTCLAPIMPVFHCHHTTTRPHALQVAKGEAHLRFKGRALSLNHSRNMYVVHPTQGLWTGPAESCVMAFNFLCHGSLLYVAQKQPSAPVTALGDPQGSDLTANTE